MQYTYMYNNSGEKTQNIKKRSTKGWDCTEIQTFTKSVTTAALMMLLETAW